MKRVYGPRQRYENLKKTLVNDSGAPVSRRRITKNLSPEACVGTGQGTENREGLRQIDIGKPDHRY